MSAASEFCFSTAMSMFTDSAPDGFFWWAPLMVGCFIIHAAISRKRVVLTQTEEVTVDVPDKSQ
jgi:hypothetical protein